MDRYLRVTALATLAFLATLGGDVRYTASDPRGTLITSQALLEHGTAKLDAYGGETYVPLADSAGTTGSFRTHRGHCYYYFPIGTSITVAPFVWLATLRGETMLDPDADARLQILLSALTVAASAVLSYLLCRSHLPPQTSVFLSALFVFGGPLISTMGTALWSANLATLWVLVCLVLLSRGMIRDSYPGPALAGTLWAAFLCRPTTGVLGLVVLTYLWLRSRRAFMRAGITVAVLAGVALLLSSLEYDTPVPSYYRIGRAGENPAALGMVAVIVLLAGWFGLGRHASRLPVPVRRGLPIGVASCAVLLAVMWLKSHLLLASATCAGLCGVWASPGRGLLVYSPYLLLTIAGLLTWRKAMAREPMVWVALAGLGLHTVIAGRPTRWWGGHCFGSRLMTEVYPLAMVLTVLVWRTAGARHFRGRGWIKGLVVAVSILSVFTNTYQGLYNPLTTVWNASPDIDGFPDYAWNWRFPQFMTSPALLAARESDHATRHARAHAMRILPPYAFGDPITPLGGSAYFEGWSDPTTDGSGVSCRYADGQARILLWAGTKGDAVDSLTVEFAVAADSGTLFELRVNGRQVLPWSAMDGRRTALTAGLPWGLIVPERATIIEFNQRGNHPGQAPSPVAFYGLVLRPVGVADTRGGSAPERRGASESNVGGGSHPRAVQG